MNNQNNHQNNHQENKREKQTYTDYNIFRGDIRLIGDNGKIEIIDRDLAIQLAKKENKNLVQIAYNKIEYPHAICKIIDYGKFKFEQKKREKENARKMKLVNAEAKEVVFSIRIDDNDYNHKISQIRDFLEDKLKVKITIKLSKRELSVKYMAIDLIKKILNNFNEIAVLDAKPLDNERIISCILRPISKR